MRDEGLLRKARGDARGPLPTTAGYPPEISAIWIRMAILYVTDRKKELLKTAAGKFVAPQPLENLLKSSPYILNAAVIGDRRRFVSALIVPNFGTLEALAREEGHAAGSHEELASAPWVRECIEKEVDRLCAKLAQYETIKRFALLPEDFSFDGGELTYTHETQAPHRRAEIPSRDRSSLRGRRSRRHSCRITPERLTGLGPRGLSRPQRKIVV